MVGDAFLSACLTIMSATALAPSPSSSSSYRAPLRILALHGKGGTGASFRRALQPLEEALAKRQEQNRPASSEEDASPSCPCLTFQFTYPNAPFDLNNGGGTDAYKSDVEGAAGDGAGKAWWTLPPGTRSFTADEYIGYAESAALVEQALCDGEGYDFVLGHSQGAILLSAVLASASSEFLCDGHCPKDEEEGRRVSGGPRTPRGYIFNGAAWPKPFGDRLEEFSPPSQTSRGPNPEALFVIGERDNINPPSGAEQVKDCLARGGLRVRTCRHPGGHSVPTRDDKALGEIADWIIRLAAQRG